MSNKGDFTRVAMNDDNPNYRMAIQRGRELYSRKKDIRSEFARDYTRILHSMAYRRLKHKTQVFFNTHNDHICTRMEHVAHVESVSHTISEYLGLNTELTKAIAMGHDLGHAPFGHCGEGIISKLLQQYCREKFWHEKNGLRVVDQLELLESPDKEVRNLDYYQKYAELVIKSIFEELYQYSEVDDIIMLLGEKIKKLSETGNEFLFKNFCDWLQTYSVMKERGIDSIVYEDISDKQTYARAIIDFIAGMTDSYAIKCFETLISF
ncbi:deoxyguanosinetriphosphate triphosphohydrolase [Lachnospiraceae bacterium KM106-2]|nr:deoxyguanosinetriphosphate triphosphohydrolase [Lachnospiraceae bacterium KM106-2]